MMASANKFLRIYYATVKAYLETLEPPDLAIKHWLAAISFSRCKAAWFDVLFLHTALP